jgi:hypothetical protein
MPTRPTTLSSTPVTVSRAAPWRPHRTSNDARESGTSSARLRFQPPPTHTHGGRPGLSDGPVFGNDPRRIRVKTLARGLCEDRGS